MRNAHYDGLQRSTLRQRNMLDDAHVKRLSRGAGSDKHDRMLRRMSNVFHSNPAYRATLREFGKDTAAVSPAVAVTLMGAVTVVLAATAYTLLSNLEDGWDSPTDGTGYGSDCFIKDVGEMPYNAKKTVERLVDDHDEFFNQPDTDDPQWVWDLSDLKGTQPRLGATNDFLANPEYVGEKGELGCYARLSDSIKDLSTKEGLKLDIAGVEFLVKDVVDKDSMIIEYSPDCPEGKEILEGKGATTDAPAVGEEYMMRANESVNVDGVPFRLLSTDSHRASIEANYNEFGGRHVGQVSEGRGWNFFDRHYVEGRTIFDDVGEKNDAATVFIGKFNVASRDCKELS